MYYIDVLKQQLISVWTEFKQSVIGKAIDQWRPRLRACVRASGQHFEQLINCNNFVCWTGLYTETVRTSNLKVDSHIVPFQFVKNSYFKLFLQGSAVTLIKWSWKIFLVVAKFHGAPQCI